MSANAKNSKGGASATSTQNKKQITVVSVNVGGLTEKTTAMLTIFLETQRPDVIFLQELKKAQLEFPKFSLLGLKPLSSYLGCFE